LARSFVRKQYGRQTPLASTTIRGSYHFPVAYETASAILEIALLRRPEKDLHIEFQEGA
jgi:hypothetical protein